MISISGREATIFAGLLREKAQEWAQIEGADRDKSGAKYAEYCMMASDIESMVESALARLHDYREKLGTRDWRKETAYLYPPKEGGGDDELATN